MRIQLLSATCLGALFCVPAQAQDQPPATTPAQSIASTGNAETAVNAQAVREDNALDQIVVTARRREEDAQTVPVSVTAFTGEALEQRGVRELDDLNLITPGLRFSQEGGKTTTTVILRGLGRNPIGEGVPAVVTYFADVPLVGEGTNVPTYDLANIQVLKGPQGTLFGRNTIGGAIVIQPERPNYDFGGYVRAEYGRFDYRTLEGAINAPIVEDKVAVRFAGQIRRGDGSIKNLNGGPDFNDVHTDAFRVSLLLEPFDGLTSTTIYDYLKAEENAGGLYFYRHNPGVIPALAFLDPFFAADRQTQIDAGFHAVQSALGVGQNPPGSAYRKLWGIANDTKLEIGDITLRNIFGLRETELESTINTQGSGPIFIGGNQFTAFIANSLQGRRYLTEEFQVLGNAFGDRLNFIFGFFYNHDKSSKPGGSRFITFTFDPSSIPFTSSHVANKNTAIYGQIGYKLTDRLTVNLGGRYSWDKVSACGGSALGNPPVPQNSFFSRDACEQQAALNLSEGVGIIEHKGEEPSWTVGLDYQATDDLFLYVTSRRGYRGVNVNTPAFETQFTTGGPGCPSGTCPDLRPFQKIEEETLTDYEIGAKWDWRSGGARGRLNVAAFRTDYKGALQFFNVVATGIPNTAPDFPTRTSIGVNAADLTIQGVEVEATVIPVAGLSFNVNAAYTDTNIKNVDVPPIGGLSLTEDQITVYAPKFSSTVAANWVAPYEPLGSELVFNADWFHTSTFGAQVGQNLPGYDVVNARIALNDIGGSNFSIAASILNLFNEKYFVAASNLLPSFPTNTAYTGDQRMWRLEAKYRF